MRNRAEPPQTLGDPEGLSDKGRSQQRSGFQPKWMENEMSKTLIVGSRMITWIFFEKGGFLSVPIFEYLEGRFVV